jgi:hypothetical protein
LLHHDNRCIVNDRWHAARKTTARHH